MPYPNYNEKTFEGKILRRDSNTIYVDIYPARECLTNDTYSIMFEVNRIGFQLQHNALDFVKRHDLFGIFINNPEYHHSNSVSQSVDISHTTSVESSLNDEQMQAIECIVNGQYNPMPYLLYGPPGEAFSNIHHIQTCISIFIKQI